MPSQTQPPKNMQPGARSVSGSGLADGAFGQPTNGEGRIVPPGANFFPQGPAEVSYYNGATPPPAGGGQREAMQTKSMPMERGK